MVQRKDSMSYVEFVRGNGKVYGNVYGEKLKTHDDYTVYDEYVTTPDIISVTEMPHHGMTGLGHIELDGRLVPEQELLSEWHSMHINTLYIASYRPKWGLCRKKRHKMEAHAPHATYTISRIPWTAQKTRGLRLDGPRTSAKRIRGERAAG
jgi:hypothetical protein